MLSLQRRTVRALMPTNASRWTLQRRTAAAAPNPTASSTSEAAAAEAAAAFAAASAAAGGAASSSSSSAQQQQNTAGSEGQGGAAAGGGAGGLSAPAEGEKVRNIRVFTNTTKAVYVHQHNRIATYYWMRTDFHFWFCMVAFGFVGSQLFVRYKVAKRATAEQAKLGESLLDQRTRELLTDIEGLRNKDPLRLESEANLFHEMFWQQRAKMVADTAKERRSVEISRGVMQGEARGTDMSEWLGAKQKDDVEREVARRTHDYIQGFHQHLKAKRLI
jgi:hypothetical protein